MTLDENQIKEILNNPYNREFIERSHRYENRIRLHTDSILTTREFTSGHNTFLSGVSNILSAEKYERFRQLFRLPVSTTDFSQSIFDEFAKIFQSNDAYKKCEFTDPSLEADFKPFEKMTAQWFRTKGFETMQKQICSVLVVDLPSEDRSEDLNNTEVPEPYFYTLDISQVYDIKVDDEGNTEYLMFPVELGTKDKKKKGMVVLDDTAYRLYEVIDNTNIILIKEQEHGLGYTPARQFWTTPLNKDSKILKKSPIANSLGRLDSLLFKEVSKDYADVFAAYPIYWGYEQKCDYTDEYGNECQSGYIYTGVTTDGTATGYNSQEAITKRKLQCPQCAEKKMIGAGSFVSVPAPELNEDADLRDPVGLLEAPVKSLEYIKKDISELKYEIFEETVGYGGRDSAMAKNKDQVHSEFESRLNTLLWVKTNFEIAEHFVLNTCGNLKYGDNFLGCNVDYGSNFFLATAETLKEEYKLSKEAGLPEWEQEAILEQLETTKYKNNPYMKKRAIILMHLDPFPAKTFKEVKEDFDAGVITQEDYILKRYFSQFIRKFERDNLDVVSFGKDLDMSTKIDRITETLNDYVNEKMDNAEGIQEGNEVQ